MNPDTENNRGRKEIYAHEALGGASMNFYSDSAILLDDWLYSFVSQNRNSSFKENFYRFFEAHSFFSFFQAEFKNIDARCEKSRIKDLQSIHVCCCLAQKEDWIYDDDLLFFYSLGKGEVVVIKSMRKR